MILWGTGFNVLFNAEQFLRGDEANLDTPLGSFAVVNLQTEYRKGNFRFLAAWVLF
ncbi:MAG: hypothetical protein H0A75_01510 [Candidatus Methanofishera endochildressiae]|uniref:Uncharacterized protein n=1 Tax=Candidatus Methanofishera endochildressiae TaxID=2738884 RepID=A0A7Z0MMU3_9GAMM|nr:hypothetical protein [Candidatus Methanofishera endochildressiae]